MFIVYLSSVVLQTLRFGALRFAQAGRQKQNKRGKKRAFFSLDRYFSVRL